MGDKQRLRNCSSLRETKNRKTKDNVCDAELNLFALKDVNGTVGGDLRVTW